MLEVRHRLPERLRLMIPGLRGNHAIRDALLKELKACNSVARARINLACGCLVVEFDSASDHHQLILRLEELLTGLSTRSQSDPNLPEQSSGAPPPTRPALHPPRRRSPLVETASALLTRWAPRPAIVPPDQPSWICHLNLRLTRWMLRTSMRALWHEQTRYATASRTSQEPRPHFGFAWLYRLSEPFMIGPTEPGATSGAVAKTRSEPLGTTSIQPG